MRNGLAAFLAKSEYVGRAIGKIWFRLACPAHSMWAILRKFDRLPGARLVKDCLKRTYTAKPLEKFFTVVGCT